VNVTYYVVDAFTEIPFQGNPAGVCLLSDWLPDTVMQHIAMENNLSETAFIVEEPPGFRIRWFSPSMEIDLCGHATLASGHVLFNHQNYSGNKLVFNSLSGQLQVNRVDEFLQLDFPNRPGKACAVPDALRCGIKAEFSDVRLSRDYLILLDSEETIRNVEIDFAELAKAEALGIIITAPGSDVDFVSRFFAPSAGIDEDPVTGSAHCTLIPYWADRLKKNVMTARQLSKRGGYLYCELDGDRVKIGGKARTYLSGQIHL